MIKNKLKKVALGLSILFMSTGAFAQNSEYLLSAGVNFGLREYNGDLGSSLFLAKGTTYNGVGIDLGYYVSPSFDVMLWGSTGDVGYTTTILGEVDPYKWRHFLTRTAEGNIGLRYKFNNGILLAEDALIAPFVQAGFGVYYGHGYVNYNPSNYTFWEGNFAGGAGINFNLNPRWTIRLQSIYNYTQSDMIDFEAQTVNHSVTNKLNMSHDGYLYTSIGVAYNFNAFGLSGGGSIKKVRDDDQDGVANKYDECKNTPLECEVDSIGCALDTDGDGVIDCQDKCPKVKGEKMFDGCPDTDADGIQDSEDACPEVKGTAEMNGCPDTDGDGLADNVDKCPNTPGKKENEGCPANDKDRDGIEDEKDKCPEIFGLAEFEGCPDSDGDGIPNSKDKCPNRAGTAAGEGCPDSDGDGVYDHKDVCPTVAGVIANKGCPEIKAEVKEEIALAAKGIFFESGKDVIKAESYENLDHLATILKGYKEAKVSIEGHTDSQGADSKNLILSQKRADAVKAYLLRNGIDASRLTAVGYGETRPKATNDNAPGRAQNRRVEFKLSY